MPFELLNYFVVWEIKNIYGLKKIQTYILLYNSVFLSLHENSSQLDTQPVKNSCSTSIRGLCCCSPWWKQVEERTDAIPLQTDEKHEQITNDYYIHKRHKSPLRPFTNHTWACCPCGSLKLRPLLVSKPMMLWGCQLDMWGGQQKSICNEIEFIFRDFSYFYMTVKWECKRGETLLSQWKLQCIAVLKYMGIT